MLHVVKMIQRRFPNHAHRIVPVLLLVSTLALLAGLGLLAAPR